MNIKGYIMFENEGLPLKLMEIIIGKCNHFSTIYKYAQNNNIHPMGDRSKRNSRYSIQSTRRILKHFFASKHPIDKTKKKVVEFHFKGGTGKSSLTVEIATHLALLGYSVLLFDGDQQGHASHTLGLDYRKKLQTFYDSVANNVSFKDIIINVFEGLDCIPANLTLDDVNEALIKSYSDENERAEVLNKYLAQVEDDYDFILFDTGPSLTELNRNIFYACNLVNIVCNTHPQSIDSLSHIWNKLQSIRNDFHQTFPDVMIVPNLYEERMSSSLETVTALNEHWGDYIIPNFAVRKCEDFPRAFLNQIPLSLTCKVNSIAFQDVSDVVRHIITKCEDKNFAPQTTAD